MEFQWNPFGKVFTLSHEFLWIPPDSQWKVGILQNSMEFLWKAFGWSLSHLVSISVNGNGQNPGASRNYSQWNPWDSVVILLELHGKQHHCHIKNSTMRIEHSHLQHTM